MDLLHNRCQGMVNKELFQNYVIKQRISKMEIQGAINVCRKYQKGAVTDLDIDSEEGRYLLTGYSDGTINIFDVEPRDQSKWNLILEEVKPVLNISKRSFNHTGSIE